MLFSSVASIYTLLFAIEEYTVFFTSTVLPAFTKPFCSHDINPIPSSSRALILLSCFLNLFSPRLTKLQHNFLRIPPSLMFTLTDSNIGSVDSESRS